MRSDRPMRIPETAGDIDPAWLTEALRASGLLDSAKVTAVDHAPIGTGQVANCSRLSIQYDEDTDAPRTLVVKTSNTDPELREKIREHGVYEREVGFYRELAGTLDARTPRAHHADLDVEAGTFVLLLDDLAPATQGDQIEGCSPEVARAALDALVGLHAPRWGDPALEQIAWFERDRSADRALRLHAMPILWEGFKKRYDDLITDEIEQAGSVFVAHLAGFLHSDHKPWTVTHADFRLDNLLLGTAADGSTSVHVVDWQTCRPGPALEDVAYFVGSGLSSDARREHEEHLVRGYYDALIDRGVAGYSFDDCWLDYRWGTWSGLMMAIYAGMIVERTDRGDRMFLTMAQRHSEHALDLDAGSLIRG